MRYWVIFFCLISISSFAQSDSAIHKPNKLSVGVVLFPQFTDRSDYKIELFVPRFGYSAGLNIIFQVTKKFSLESGILFSKKGWNFTWDNLTFGDMIDPRYGFTYQTQQVGVTKGYEFQSIDIPLKINWTPGKKKFRFLAGVGCAASFNLSGYRVIGEKNEHESLNANIAEIGMLMSFNAGAVYFINDHFSIRMLPEFQYLLFEPAKIFSDYKTMTLGINANLIYHF
jgi:hypothetical protein